jgi:hypothetical protein
MILRSETVIEAYQSINSRGHLGVILAGYRQPWPKD